ncbi:MAG TPA: tRNA pseudouridine(54/55) synthase Pus10 [Planctomycetota bacterium]|jgi:tRNA pseudouridine synthase 10|nr:tRNA pseudouridine(54/55) synthase Pus10 [Planctomycetota bacterium]
MPAPSAPAPRPKVRVLFEGRYRKFVRDLPQTVFFCPDCKGRGKGCTRCGGFGKLTKDSVQELIARVAMPRFKARRNKFHGAGREDVDVRMLGPGRPFVFEVLGPKVPRPDLAEIETEVNRRYEGRLQLLDLRWCDRKRVAAVKEGKQVKEYEALVVPEPSPDSGRLRELVGRRVEVVQRTPERVAHRRADLERRRWIQLTAVDAVEGGLRVRVRSAHGTYIKEAISGEGGRTTPSLASLLDVRCECRELDVVNMFEESEAGAAAEKG